MEASEVWRKVSKESIRLIRCKQSIRYVCFVKIWLDLGGAERGKRIYSPRSTWVSWYYSHSSYRHDATLAIVVDQSCNFFTKNLFFFFLWNNKLSFQTILFLFFFFYKRVKKCVMLLFLFVFFFFIVCSWLDVCSWFFFYFYFYFIQICLFFVGCFFILLLLFSSIYYILKNCQMYL